MISRRQAMNLEKLQQKAHELALTDDLRYGRKPSSQFIRDFHADVDKLKQMVNDLQHSTAVCPQPAEEWLLDNAGFLLEQAASVRESLNLSMAGRLPQLSRRRIPRLLPLCLEFLDQTDGEVDEPSVIAYIQSYQEVSPLSISEVWSLPLFFRIALFRKLADIAEQIRERREVCQRVERLLSRMKANLSDPDSLSRALDEAEQELPLSGPTVVHLARHLREWEDDSAAVQEWLKCKLDNRSESLENLQTLEYQLQAAYQMRTGNLIRSLRVMERWNITTLFEKISLVEHTLRQERSGIYPQLDFTSRNTLRRRVEALARRFRVPETTVAQEAVKLAAAFAEEQSERSGAETGLPADPPPRRSIAAYYLLEEDGIRQLQRALSSCGAMKRKPFTMPVRRGAGRYFSQLGALFFVSLVLSGWWIAASTPAFLWADLLVIAAAILLPASEWSVTVAHWLICHRAKPMPLLRYDYSDGIPVEAATMIIIPVIWSSIEEVEEMTDRLEMHYLANRDPHMYYALLSDFTDAKEERLPEDDAVVQAARAKIAELNKQYNASGGRFFLFQRKRRWNPAENVWMGWERKRGKLVEFVEWLRGSKETSYDVVEGPVEELPLIRYLITLDADTQLPSGAAQRMVATMHLPYNRPRLNEKRTRVVEGYGVLQPRIQTSYLSATNTRFSALWSGDPGLDPYAFAVSDPYQDGVGEAIFVGKGIFDVDVFAEVLCDRIPENRVLSHDLLEGGFMRAGLLSDIELLDEQPATFYSFQKRLHRWVRGDWQLLAWLFPRARDRKGTLAPVDLSPIHRWQMVDNLRRSLMPPALLIIFLLGMTVLPGASWRWQLLVVATAFLPVLRQCFSIRHLWENPRSLATVGGQSFLMFAVLPFQAVLLVDAIVTAIYRLFISKRRLLEWVSAAAVERQSRRGRHPLMFGMTAGYALTALAAITAFLQPDPAARWLGLAVAAVWAFAPVLVNWLNQSEPRPEQSFAETERKELRELAEQIWQFYEETVTEENHWLPPDNVQLDPPNGTAHRTSPTNIGMYLASALAARDFGFIDTPGLIMRLERTIATIERMERWHGHLLNWIDTKSLRPLQPKYVSTVDSGNLVCALIAVKEGLAEWLNRDADLPGLQDARVQNEAKNLSDRGHTWRFLGRQLLDRIESLIEQTDFRPLYDPSTQLLSLGCDATTGRLDTVQYDLLASEARQASFVAIALGQIPAEHWSQLGRTLTRVCGRIALISWSGTMFEYLMPGLFMRTYRKTLWSETLQAVVDRQMEYGLQKGVPFGISESGFYSFDYQHNYQYRAFGVPGLGFQRGLERDLVVAPYASIMALPYAGRAALENMRRLERLGARGKYGFYEAVDFTADRIPNGETHRVVRSFMAHHQGMSLLAIANVLNDSIMTERFHRDKRVRSVETLLQERIPQRPKLIKSPVATGALSVPDAAGQTRLMREFQYNGAPVGLPDTCILSNGKMTAVVTDSGSGFIRFDGLEVTRWKSDALGEDAGLSLYIRDVADDRVWSPGFYPCGTPSVNQRVQFALDRAVFTREDGEIRTQLEIGVSPEWNADLRKLTLLNLGSEPRVVEVTSYYELVLAPKMADEAHPAFSKLFVETAFEESEQCLIARRRPRHDGDKAVWAAHKLFADGELHSSPEYETDRAEFIGRGYARDLPLKLRSRLRGTTGAVTDPAFVMRRRLTLQPGEEFRLYAVTSVGETKEEVLDTMRRINGDDAVERSYHLAWTYAQIELRHLGLSLEDAADFQRLAGRLIYRPPLDETQQKFIPANTKSQADLWPYGISGDRPILLVQVSHRSHLPFVAKLLSGFEYLRRLGIGFDLVLLNESEEGYQQAVADDLARAVEDRLQKSDNSAGVFVLNRRSLSEEMVILLFSAANLVIRAGARSLKAQIRSAEKRTRISEERLSSPRLSKMRHLDSRLLEIRQSAAQPSEPELPSSPSSATRPSSRPAETQQMFRQPPAETRAESQTDSANHDGSGLMFYNGWGGFAADGREYRIQVDNSRPLPAPWINVMANARFGCFVSELGTGYTWWRNSRECKLTPWSNDPVLDIPGEIGYLRDERSGQSWTLFPWGAPAGYSYEAVHSLGYSRFRHERNGVLHETAVFVPKDDPVKILEVRIVNQTDGPRQMSLTYYAEWVLGVQREQSAPFIVTEWDETAQVLFAENMYQEHFRGAAAFMQIFSAEPEQVRMTEEKPRQTLTWTGDRSEFIGRGRSLRNPAAMERTSLSGQTGANGDPCGAVQLSFELSGGEEQVVYIVFGCGSSRAEALDLAKRYRNPAKCRGAFDEVVRFWEETVRQTVVSTPSAEMDLLMNGWLLYQTLSCRMWGRSAFYQSGGAYGYRDQLQDSLSILHTRPDLTRKQIILHASHQYEEGDVQHWWHEETGRGIRTLYSDDYLWLPYAISRYVEHTGDVGLLDVRAPYLKSGLLQGDEHERYEETRWSALEETIYQHGLRALDRAISRLGEHGLPLIGIGDWNDGMNRIGAAGRGESVWLAWFLYHVLDRYTSVCEKRGDHEHAERYRRAMSRLAEAADQHGWDGAWFRRAFDDHGRWLGTVSGEECRIDAIAQSWSVISGAAAADKALQAMQSFDRELVDRELSLARLLTPPFDRSHPSPGYIQGYPPGIRENGGQYTHGVIWSIVAWSMLGNGDKAFELFHRLNPVTHTKTEQDVRQYAGEPYAVAADVYTAPPHEGKAGWTWYTGAAGWLYQAGLEWILGLRREGTKLHIQPSIPRHWPGFSVRYRYGSAWYHIRIHNARVDGQPGEEIRRQQAGDSQPEKPGFTIDLIDDGKQHEFDFTIGQPARGNVVLHT
jgi:cellobiose phosphorylase